MKKMIPNWKVIAFPLIAVFLLYNCQKEQTSLTEYLTPTQDTERVINLKKQGKLSSILDLPEPKFNFSQLPNQVALSRNADYEVVNEQLLDIIQHKQEDFEAMINPEDFECNPTILDDYFAPIVNDFTEEEQDLLFDFGFFIPLLEAILIDDDRDQDFFGYEGRFTSSIRFHFIKLKTFWDIPTDIQLSDWHGTVFQNVPLVAQLIQFGYVFFDEEGNPIPIPDDAALAFAQELSDLFGMDKFDNYNHPFFSFNAVAFAEIPELGIPKKIAMGDGVMEVYAELGLGSMAERFILAHEYGHHLHFAKDIFGDNTPEATRFLELLADTYASYYASHGKGLGLKRLFIDRYIKISSSIGDCAFDSPGHHGTPNQRGRAAALGGELSKRIHLFDPEYSSDEILEFYIAAFPELVIPDAG